MDNLDQNLASRAYVRNFVERELKLREMYPQYDEPEVTFSVKLPVTVMARLEQVASYLGYKKTPLASNLLAEAVEDAYWAIIQAEDENGKGEEARAHFEQRHYLEDGSGWVGRGPSANGEGEVG